MSFRLRRLRAMFTVALVAAAFVIPVRPVTVTAAEVTCDPATWPTYTTSWGATYFDVSGQNLSGCEFSDLATFYSMRAVGTNFDGITAHSLHIVYASDFSGATFRGADLSASQYGPTVFENSYLPNVDFTGANLAGLSVAGTYVEGSNFTNTNVAGISWTGTNLCPDGQQRTGTCLNDMAFIRPDSTFVTGYLGRPMTVTGKAGDPVTGGVPAYILARSGEYGGTAGTVEVDQATGTWTWSMIAPGLATRSPIILDGSGTFATGQFFVDIADSLFIGVPTDQVVSESAAVGGSEIALPSFEAPGAPAGAQWDVTIDWGGDTGRDSFTVDDPSTMPATRWHRFIGPSAPLDVYTVTMTVHEVGTNIGKSMSFTVTVENTVELYGTSAVVHEASNDPIGLWLFDARNDGPWTLNIDWGDGSTSTVPVTTTGEVFLTHPEYRARSQSDTYLVNIEAVDALGGRASIQLWVGVIAVPPTFTGSSAYVPEGTNGPVMIGGFSDVGNGPWHFHVDWSDGATADWDGATQPAPVVVPARAYNQVGTLYGMVTVTDAAGGQTSDTFTVVVVNVAPTVDTPTFVGDTVEGGSFTPTATFSHPATGETLTCGLNYGDGVGYLGTVDGSTCIGPTRSFPSAGTHLVTFWVRDANGATATAQATLTIRNVAPVVSPVTIVPPTALGQLTTATTSFSDPGAGAAGAGETYSATITWGDGSSSSQPVRPGTNTVTASHVYARAGVYVVTVSVSDGAAAGSATGEAIVYDPARTLSGKGTVSAPSGACRLTPACGVAATASFSVSAKYARGATTPTLSFSWSATGFSLSATSGAWFAAGGGKAVLSGNATVNRVGGYTFRLTVLDGSPDKASLQVRDASNVLVYDTGAPISLRSGSITIK